MSDSADERWLTYREVGRVLGVGERAALNWVKEHELPVAPGRPARVLLSAVVAQAEALKRPLAPLPNHSEALPNVPNDPHGTATTHEPHTSEVCGSASEPLEAQYRVTPAEIEQAVARTSAQYMGDLRTMLTEVGKVYEGQLAAKDETIDELRRRAEVAEAEAEGLRLRLAEGSVPAVPFVAGQVATKAAPATATASDAHRPAQCAIPEIQGR